MERQRTIISPHIFWLIALPVLVIDQVTKWWVIQSMPLNTTRPAVDFLFPYLKWSHVANTGAVFGSFQGVGNLFAILAVVVAIGIVYYNYRLNTTSRRLRIALGLVFGGALGNMIDRLIVGHVTDFIDIDLSSIIPLRIADWYIFNVADMAIIGAIIIMAYLSFFEPDELESADATPQSPELATKDN
jgi:signal peptidase II